jgi:hypothetical protein
MLLTRLTRLARFTPLARLGAATTTAFATWATPASASMPASIAAVEITVAAISTISTIAAIAPVPLLIGTVVCLTAGGSAVVRGLVAARLTAAGVPSGVAATAALSFASRWGGRVLD